MNLQLSVQHLFSVKGDNFRDNYSVSSIKPHFIEGDCLFDPFSINSTDETPYGNVRSFVSSGPSSFHSCRNQRRFSPNSRGVGPGFFTPRHHRRVESTRARSGTNSSLSVLRGARLSPQRTEKTASEG